MKIGKIIKMLFRFPVYVLFFVMAFFVAPFFWVCKSEESIEKVRKETFEFLCDFIFE